jgi:ATP-dependent 26S proteasome regulatory subunit
MESLASISEGLSGADLEAVCETAKRFACRRTSGNSDVQPAVIQEDVVKAIERIRVDVHSFS